MVLNYINSNYADAVNKYFGNLKQRFVKALELLIISMCRFKSRNIFCFYLNQVYFNYFY